MARWSDVITLIKTPAEDQIDKDGFPLPPEEESSRVIFANKKPAWQSEFFNAQLSGIEIRHKFDIYTIEYDGERLAEYEGKRYRIVRAGESKNGELTELTLSDLSEKGVDLCG